MQTPNATGGASPTVLRIIILSQHCLFVSWILATTFIFKMLLVCLLASTFFTQGSQDEWVRTGPLWVVLCMKIAGLLRHGPVFCDIVLIMKLRHMAIWACFVLRPATVGVVFTSCWRPIGLEAWPWTVFCWIQDVAVFCCHFHRPQVCQRFLF